MNLPRSRPATWTSLVVVAVAAVLIGSGFTVIYVTSALSKMCTIIELQASDDPPPTTDRGATIQREAKKLAREYNCKE